MSGRLPAQRYASAKWLLTLFPRLGHDYPQIHLQAGRVKLHRNDDLSKRFGLQRWLWQRFLWNDWRRVELPYATRQAPAVMR